MVITKIKPLKSLEDISKYTSFLQRGFRELCEKGKYERTWEHFFMVLTKCTLQASGEVAVLLTQSNKALGFILVLDNSHEFTGKSAYIYATYVDGTYSKSVHELEAYAINWARGRDIHVIQAATRRINGAAFRWFESKLGWKRDMLVFKKEV